MMLDLARQGEVDYTILSSAHWNYDAQMQRITNEERSAISQDVSSPAEIQVKNLNPKEVITNAAGVYSLKSVESGDFCLHAEVNLQSCFAEWIINIHLKDEPEVHIDLFNDNATGLILN